jgi:hypothetical protein
MPTAVQSIRQRVTTPAAQDAFKRWFDASPAYSGGVLANQLGWQVARTVAKNGAIALRGATRAADVPTEYATALDDDGILVIPDYLNADRHRRLVEACDVYGSSDNVRDIGAENGSRLVYRTGQVISDVPNDAASVINGLLASDPLICALGRRVIHRAIRPPFTLVYQDLELGEAPDDRDREQLLHTDKFFSCAKAIYFVDEVSAESSPFVYCPGSHRLSVERLRWEYAMSVREAQLRAHRVGELTDSAEICFERSRNVIGLEFRRRLQLDERPITCPANTLVVVNNRGFHRRGVLRRGARRRSLWVNFYPYQRPVYGRVAFAAAKRVIDTNNVPRDLSAVNRQSLSDFVDVGASATREGH